MMSQAVRSKTCEKKIKSAEIKMLKILNKIESLKLNSSYISRLDVANNNTSIIFPGITKKFVFIFALVLIFLFSGSWIYDGLNLSKRCLLEVSPTFKTLFRPPEDCSMCVDVTDVVRISNITAEEFEVKYAYSASPVIVTDATSDWKAMKKFNYKFFADFYSAGDIGKQINDCFYFPYKSGLDSLKDVFSMDEARANLSGEPWYVGWSTCHDEETRRLRSYYDRPYFLPKTAESDMVDWIFMGGPGQGAHMHVDSVRHMSWQAQIRGHKQWELAPPPECLYRCTWITFTVSPGDILVVDTNRWYHKTNVLTGDISITIGAEYD